MTSNVYNVGLRMLDTQYPSVSGAYLRHYYDSSNSVSDRLNRLGGLRLHDGGLGAGNRMHHVHYRYSGTGRLATLYSNSSSTFGVNVRLDRFSNVGNYDSFDRFGRVVEQKWTRAGGTLDHFTMQHDYAGNLIQRNNVLRNANRSYGYDNLNRLLSSSETGSGASTAHRRYWDLDQLGNWEKLRGGSTASSSVLETRTFNQANELQTNTGGANPVHDEAGNMTGIPDPVNLNSLLGGTYDAWNRLVALGSETYVYDGLNRRIIRQSGQAKHFYYNESWQVLTEADGSGSATAIYSYHPNFVDAVAVRMTPTDEHFFTHDHQYSVTSAVDRASASVVERYDYSPYGESTVLDANFAVDADGQSDINNEYRYTGRRLDPSGLQLHRNRYYHPQLGQWINRDPLGYVDGMSLYRGYFVPGRGDPLGLFRCKCECFTVSSSSIGGSFTSTGSTYFEVGGKFTDARKDCKKQCRENSRPPCKSCYGSIVEEETESIWICSRKFWSHGLYLTHKYICCDGPNDNCRGHRNNDLIKGDPIPTEGSPTGNCREVKVSKRLKRLKCKSPVSPCNAGTFTWNCCSWAECGINDFPDDQPGIDDE